MTFILEEAIEILSRTPNVLNELIGGLSDNWISFKKHPKAFNPIDVLNHFILGEKTDWIPRMNIMLAEQDSKEFPPFNPEGFEPNSDLKGLLKEFKDLRNNNLDELRLKMTKNDLQNIGIHPKFGEVTLEQHLATWVTHDLTHLFQITESLALRYKETVGPWIEFLRILNLKN